MHKLSIYSKLYVKYSRRSKFTPKVSRVWRPRVMAWAGPDAFVRDRFYEFDSWYKARIQRPELLPKLHIIDPDLIVESFEDKTRRRRDRILDIGFKKVERVPPKMTGEQRARLEELAVKNELLVDLDSVDSDNQLTIAEHLNIFEDLFMPGVYFHNTQPMSVQFGADGSSEQRQQRRVFYGNIVQANNAVRPPSVSIRKPHSEANGFNTFLMLNLEGPGQEIGDPDAAATTEQQRSVYSSLDPQDLLLQRLGKRRQLVHWLIANIPDSPDHEEQSVLAGEELVPYLAPAPFYGTGYHRFAFLLFRHPQPINFSDHFLKGADSLTTRTFNTNSFYKAFEDQMSPSALRFCQIKWDESVDCTLHALGLKSPRYWYEWNDMMVPEQKEFPMKAMPFHHYMDMYRNPETVRREVQKRRLDKMVKLKPNEKLEPEKYPDPDYMSNWMKKPQFEHERMMKENAGEGVWVAMYRDYENPMEQHVMDKYRQQGQGDGAEGHGRDGAAPGRRATAL